MKVRFLRVSYFAWILLPAALFLAYLLFGLPHMIWSYDWLDQGHSYGDFKNRHYTRCTFIGPYGAFTTYPTNGKCGWVLLRKSGEKG